MCTPKYYKHTKVLFVVNYTIFCCSNINPRRLKLPCFCLSVYQCMHTSLHSSGADLFNFCKPLYISHEKTPHRKLLNSALQKEALLGFIDSLLFLTMIDHCLCKESNNRLKTFNKPGGGVTSMPLTAFQYSNLSLKPSIYLNVMQ